MLPLSILSIFKHESSRIFKIEDDIDKDSTSRSQSVERHQRKLMPFFSSWAPFIDDLRSLVEVIDEQRSQIINKCDNGE